MSRKVALIHTSLVFFERERMLFDLLDEILPHVERVNIVEDRMLRNVMDLGYIPPEVTRRMCYYVLAAEAMGVEAILNTCSSLGPTMEVAKSLVNIPVVRIDEAMAEKAAREGRKVAVLATVPTTLDPTIDLVHQKAESITSQIELRPVLCEGAFETLMSGDTKRHDDMVSEVAMGVSDWADTIVLAQCSMARLSSRLSRETGATVLSSPRLGVQHLREVIERSQLHPRRTS